MANALKLYNVSVDSKIYDNEIDNQITWTNFHNLTYSGTIQTRAVFTKTDSTNYPHIEIEGIPTKIFIADSVWQIDPFTATIDSNAIQINHFKFYNDQQEIAVNGKIAEDKSNILSVYFSDLDLKNLGIYLNTAIDLRGIVNGSAGIMDFYGQRKIYSDLSINNLAYEDQFIGDVALTNQWDNLKSLINSKLTITKNNRQSLNATGTYNPSTNELDYNAILDHLSVVILATVIRDNFSNLHGDATGHVKVHGTPDNVLLNGALEGLNAGLTIDYTQVSYNFTDSVYFKGDTIDFANIHAASIQHRSPNVNGRKLSLIH